MVLRLPALDDKSCVLRMTGSSGMTSFYFLRHAPTAWNGQKRMQGRTDVPLTEASIAALSALSVDSHRQLPCSRVRRLVPYKPLKLWAEYTYERRWKWIGIGKGKPSLSFAAR